MELTLCRENILLDESGNLKVSDFGLSTLFRHKGKQRTLKTPCGSPPYLAPEIRQQSYDGSKIDLWSCAIILFVMLVGNTAWGEPTELDQDFVDFENNYPNLSGLHAWNTIPPLALVSN